MKKYLVAAVVALVILVAGGVFYLLSNLNSIVAGVLEEQGGRVTATDVAVSGVDISLREGRSTIAGLSISSPDGFDAKNAFTLGEATVDIDLESVRKDPIVIDEIIVRAPVVNAEFLEDGSSNIRQLQENVERFAASAGGGGAGEGGESEDVKRIRIKRFVFEKGRIEVDASALGLETQALELPAFRLDDIGGAGGARPDEIAQAVLGALTRKATTEIARAGIDRKARDLATEEVEKQAQGLLDKIGN